MRSLFVPVLAAVLSAFGQVLLKFSMMKHGPIDFSFFGIVRLFSEPLLIGALFLYFTTLVMWLHVLSKYPLSVAYPILAVTYVVVPLLSVFFFNDRIAGFQIAGISIIVIGLIVLGQGR